jgi:hypothetical protein
MELSFARSAQVSGVLLLLAAVTQSAYSALSAADAEVPRQLLWGTEAVIFVLLAAFAGSALAQTKVQHLAWSAITAAAILNVVQVGVGLTMFRPFFEASGAIEALTPAARAVVAFSFMVYNAAKALLALALAVFGLAKLKAKSRALGGTSVAIGIVALGANMASMGAGRGVFGDFPLAGASGVVATVLLATCVLTLPNKDSDRTPD